MMKFIFILLFSVSISILAISCNNNLSQERINKIDNEFANNNFSYNYLENLEVNKETSYYQCLTYIAYFINEKSKVDYVGVTYVEAPKFNMYYETGLLFYFLSKKRRSRIKNTQEYYETYLGKSLNMNYYNLEKYYRAAYQKDIEKQNIWVRIGISIVLSENSHYEEAIKFIGEAEEINPENNYIKELMVKNMLLLWDSTSAKTYLDRIPKSYKFNELDKDIRNKF